MTANTPPVTATAPRTKLFISYRREDTAGSSGRLRDWLCIAFGRENVFHDVTSLGVGPWRSKIDQALASSRVFLAVVGPRWADDKNLARLHNPEDVVRQEITSALNDAAVTVVPALVEGASLPAHNALPEVLRGLLTQDFKTVSGPGWEDDTRRMVEEIAQETGLSVRADLGALMRYDHAAREQLANRSATSTDPQQLQALQQTIDDLRRRLAEASTAERSGLAAAYAALARGDSRLAEDSFELVYNTHSWEAKTALRTAAEAARNVANLAMTRDVSKARKFYLLAQKADPENIETSSRLAIACVALGDLDAAMYSNEEALRGVRTRADDWLLMATLDVTADICTKRGDDSGAIDARREGLEIAQRRYQGAPEDPVRQQDLAKSYIQIGSLMFERRDFQGAQLALSNALGILEPPTPAWAVDSAWLLDLSICQTKVGDLLWEMANHSGALHYFRASLGNAEEILSRDLSKLQWKRAVAICQSKVGKALLGLGQHAEALSLFHSSHAIAVGLATLDKANTEWQRDLSVSYEKLGNAHMAMADYIEARQAYGARHAIAKALTSLDSTNTQWQRDLSVSHNKIGDVLVAQGDGAGALLSFRKGLAIRETLAARDTANTEWQVDVAVSHSKFGALAGTPVAERRAHLQKGLDILEALAAAGRLHANRDLRAWFKTRLAALK
jgi:tetratricopeptide (TPR) repeat protein